MDVNFDDILSEFKQAFKDKVDASGHNSSGGLANSMTYETSLNAKGYLITLTLPEYAIYMEDGTKPHFPPIDAIKKWIEIKPILPRPLPNGKLPTTQQLAYLIGRKIAREGTKPTHIISDSLNEFSLVNKLYNRLAETIQKDIEKESFSAEII